MADPVDYSQLTSAIAALTSQINTSATNLSNSFGAINLTASIESAFGNLTRISPLKVHDSGLDSLFGPNSDWANRDKEKHGFLENIRDSLRSTFDANLSDLKIDNGFLSDVRTNLQGIAGNVQTLVTHITNSPKGSTNLTSSIENIAKDINVIKSNSYISKINIGTIVKGIENILVNLLQNNLPKMNVNGPAFIAMNPTSMQDAQYRQMHLDFLRLIDFDITHSISRYLFYIYNKMPDKKDNRNKEDALLKKEKDKLEKEEEDLENLKKQAQNKAEGKMKDILHEATVIWKKFTDVVDKLWGSLKDVVNKLSPLQSVLGLVTDYIKDTMSYLSMVVNMPIQARMEKETLKRDIVKQVSDSKINDVVGDYGVSVEQALSMIYDETVNLKQLPYIYQTKWEQMANYEKQFQNLVNNTGMRADLVGKVAGVISKWEDYEKLGVSFANSDFVTTGSKLYEGIDQVIDAVGQSYKEIRKTMNVSIGNVSRMFNDNFANYYAITSPNQEEYIKSSTSMVKALGKLDSSILDSNRLLQDIASHRDQMAGDFFTSEFGQMLLLNTDDPWAVKEAFDARSAEGLTYGVESLKKGILENFSDFDLSEMNTEEFYARLAAYKIKDADLVRRIKRGDSNESLQKYMEDKQKDRKELLLESLKRDYARQWEKSYQFISPNVKKIMELGEEFSKSDFIKKWKEMFSGNSTFGIKVDVINQQEIMEATLKDVFGDNFRKDIMSLIGTLSRIAMDGFNVLVGLAGTVGSFLSNLGTYGISMLWPGSEGNLAFHKDLADNQYLLRMQRGIVNLTENSKIFASVTGDILNKSNTTLGKMMKKFEEDYAKMGAPEWATPKQRELMKSNGPDYMNKMYSPEALESTRPDILPKASSSGLKTAGVTAAIGITGATVGSWALKKAGQKILEGAEKTIIKEGGKMLFKSALTEVMAEAGLTTAATNAAATVGASAVPAAVGGAGAAVPAAPVAAGTAGATGLSSVLLPIAGLTLSALGGWYGTRYLVDTLKEKGIADVDKSVTGFFYDKFFNKETQMDEDQKRRLYYKPDGTARSAEEVAAILEKRHNSGDVTYKQPSEALTKPEKDTNAQATKSLEKTNIATSKKATEITKAEGDMTRKQIKFANKYLERLGQTNAKLEDIIMPAVVFFNKFNNNLAGQLNTYLSGMIKLIQEQSTAPSEATAEGTGGTGGGTFRGYQGGSVFNAPITGNYMENRGNHYHNGIDFGAPGGTPLPATEKAIVADVEHNPALGGGYGKLVFLKGLESGMYIGYAHLSEVNARKGQEVSPGEMIGRVGNTGHSFGDHLHFMVGTNVGFPARDTGSTMNPLDYLKGKNITVKNVKGKPASKTLPGGLGRLPGFGWVNQQGSLSGTGIGNSVTNLVSQSESTGALDAVRDSYDKGYGKYQFTYLPGQFDNWAAFVRWLGTKPEYKVLYDTLKFSNAAVPSSVKPGMTYLTKHYRNLWEQAQDQYAVKNWLDVLGPQVNSRGLPFRSAAFSFSILQGTTDAMRNLKASGALSTTDDKQALVKLYRYALANLTENGFYTSRFIREAKALGIYDEVMAGNKKGDGDLEGRISGIQHNLEAPTSSYVGLANIFSGLLGWDTSSLSSLLTGTVQSGSWQESSENNTADSSDALNILWENAQEKASQIADYNRVWNSRNSAPGSSGVTPLSPSGASAGVSSDSTAYAIGWSVDNQWGRRNRDKININPASYGLRSGSDVVGAKDDPFMQGMAERQAGRGNWWNKYDPNRKGRLVKKGNALVYSYEEEAKPAEETAPTAEVAGGQVPVAQVSMSGASKKSSDSQSPSLYKEIVKNQAEMASALKKVEKNQNKQIALKEKELHIKEAELHQSPPPPPQASTWDILKAGTSAWFQTAAYVYDTYVSGNSAKRPIKNMKLNNK